MRRERPPERKVLNNGLTVVVEHLPVFPSVTAGVWVKQGSRCETPAMQGASHFIEHLVFKGTPTRAYSEIYKAFDRMGGVLDAFTSREIMGFYFRVQKSHFEEAFSILSDMLAHPLLPPEEIERERGVILEEIKMVNDTPSDVAGDLFLQRAFPGNPLGHPVQGTEATVSGLKRPALLAHYRRLMQPQNLVLTVTGDATMEEVLPLAAKVLGKMPKGATPPAKPPKFKPGKEIFSRDHIEQAQILIGFGADPANSPRYFAILILANLLGGTMSSRLFTEIREKRGLVYSISAEHSGFSDAGLFGIQAATGHKQAQQTVNEIIKVLGDFTREGAAAEELEVARENLLGGTILSLESPSSRMGRLARNELFYGRQRPVKESLESLKKVTAKEIVRVARDLFREDNLLVAVMGKPSALENLDLGPLAERR
ncbi:MAG: insulinase family protein [Acidobacteria bacterium]|jgi:predicted Zn-dependent peptidase|nr:insulinase family protein [Acidobacteriota bacterium]